MAAAWHELAFTVRNQPPCAVERPRPDRRSGKGQLHVRYPTPVPVQEQFGYHWLTGRGALIATLNVRMMPTMPEIRRAEERYSRIPEGYSHVLAFLDGGCPCSTEPAVVRLGKVHASHFQK